MRRQVISSRDTAELKFQHYKEVIEKVYNDEKVEAYFEHTKKKVNSIKEKVEQHKETKKMQQELREHKAVVQHPSFSDRKIHICLDCRHLCIRNKCTPCHGVGCTGAEIVKNGIMFIGEAPGFTENRDKVPFVGTSGKLLRRYIEAYNMEEYSYLTNVVHCQPESNKRPGLIDIQHCSRYLQNEVQKNDPKVIVLLGATAAGSMLGKRFTTMGKIVNKPFQVKDKIFMVMYHPSYIIRSNEIKSYEEGFEKLSKILKKLKPLYGIDDKKMKEFKKYEERSQIQKKETRLRNEHVPIIQGMYEAYIQICENKGEKHKGYFDFVKVYSDNKKEELGVDLYEIIYKNEEHKVNRQQAAYNGGKLPDYCRKKRGRKAKDIGRFKSSQVIRV
jgi:DNA polymerase